MQDFFDEQIVIAGSVAVVYSIICVIFFIRFVQSVINKFQGVNLIRDVTETAEKLIDEEIENRNYTSDSTADKTFNSAQVLTNGAG